MCRAAPRCYFSNDIPGAQVAFGAEAVASNIMRFWAGRTLVSVPLGAVRSVVLGFGGRRLAASGPVESVPLARRTAVRHAAQGSRMSVADDELEHVVVVPGGLLAPAA